MSSCSKNDHEQDHEQEQIEVISINGIDHKIIDAGFTLSEGYESYTIVQFIIEDPEGQNNRSTIEIQLPTSLTGNWYILAPHNPSWRVILRSTYVGYGTDMGMISEGRVLIEQLGQIDKDNKSECHVAFEITLTDGTTALADVYARFKNSPLWAIR